MILILLTGLLEKGGIQRVSRHYVSVISDYALSVNKEYYVLSLNDDSSLKNFNFNDKNYKIRGCNNSKIKFIILAIFYGVKSHFLITSHKNLSPVCKLIQILKPRVKYMIIAHGREIWDFTPSWLLRKSFESATKILAVSNYTKQKIIDIYLIKENKIEVINNALDPEFFRIKKEEYKFPFNNDMKVILTVSRLNKSEPGKGVDLVIKSLPKVIESVRNLKYVVIGSGDLIGELSNLADSLRVKDNITFIENVNDEVLYSYYKRSDLFVMPSKQEGFGVVFVEAMYFEKPVIGSKAGGVEDIIIHGENGFLVSDDNVEELSEYINDLLSDKNMYEQFSKNAKRTVEDKFMFKNFQYNLNTLMTEMQI